MLQDFEIGQKVIIPTYNSPKVDTITVKTQYIYKGKIKTMYGYGEITDESSLQTGPTNALPLNELRTYILLKQNKNK